MAKRNYTNMLLAAADPKQFAEAMEQDRQQNFEDRMVEKVLRYAGYTGAEIGGMRKAQGELGLNFGWFNQTQNCPIQLAARKHLQSMCYMDEVRLWHSMKPERSPAFRLLLDTIESDPEAFSHAIFLRYPDLMYDLVLHPMWFGLNVHKFQHGFESKLTVDDQEYLLEELNHFLANMNFKLNR